MAERVSRLAQGESELGLDPWKAGFQVCFQPPNLLFNIFFNIQFKIYRKISKAQRVPKHPLSSFS